MTPQPPDKAQPAVPCKKCGHATPHKYAPKMNKSEKRLEPMWCEMNDCTCCRFETTPSPSLELGPVREMIGHGLKSCGEHGEMKGMKILNTSCPKCGWIKQPGDYEKGFADGQQALLKGGLDREKVKRFIEEAFPDTEKLCTAIESGHLDVTPDNEGKGVES